MIPLFLNLGTPELLIIGFAVVPLILFVVALLNIIRNNNLNQNTKLLWVIMILIAPIIGALIYLFWGKNKRSII